MWNLVAHRTREGDVYARLLEKIAVEAEALGGTVFDVLGELTFEGKPLRQLLIEAVLLGATAHVQAEGAWNNDLMQQQVKAPIKTSH